MLADTHGIKLFMRIPINLHVQTFTQNEVKCGHLLAHFCKTAFKFQIARKFVHLFFFVMFD